MNAMTYKSVIIIGGGVMGLGTAFHLAEKGYKVTVLEKANDTATVSARHQFSYLFLTNEPSRWLQI